MPTYQYKGYNPDGREISGSLTADSLAFAKEQLRQQKILLSYIASKESESFKGVYGFRNRRISVSLLAMFTRRLATLVSASVPLHEALHTVQQQETHPALRSVLERLINRLAEGSTLARAMAAEPELFSAGYVAMVAAGEAGGALDTILERLADFQERQEEIRRTVSSALAYPILMALVGSGVMLFLLAFVIPKITGIFSDNNAALPFLTIVLLKLSSLLQKGWWFILLLSVAVVFVYRRLLQQASFLAVRDRWLLRLPLIGTLLQTHILARFSRILALLIKSGVPLLKALEISSKAVVNRSYRTVLDEAALRMAEGDSLSATLEASRLFPPLLTHLIQVGEKSGTLEESLETAGRGFEKEFEVSVTRFISLLEPIMVLAMGLMVGLVVVAVLLPIFELNQLIK